MTMLMSVYFIRWADKKTMTLEVIVKQASSSGEVSMMQLYKLLLNGKKPYIYLQSVHANSLSSVWIVYMALVS